MKISQKLLLRIFPYSPPPFLNILSLITFFTIYISPLSLPRSLFLRLQQPRLVRTLPVRVLLIRRHSPLLRLLQSHVQVTEHILGRMVDDVLDLQLVLVVLVRVRQLPELVRQLEAVGDVLRRHKVLGHLDAVVQVPHLMRCPSRNEYRITQTL